jgi:hypothetical protein
MQVDEKLCAYLTRLTVLIVDQTSKKRNYL